MDKCDFYKGMDISFLPQFTDKGMQVKDFDGTVVEPFLLLKKYGVNSIRLRIWKNPENEPESGGYCSLAHTLAMARKIKEWGMHFLLDFHYSDYWADPANQRKPKEWEGLSFEELEHAVFDYTKDTLLSLKKEGLLPDIVQIGNEIRSGLLFPDGELPDYIHMVRLLNAGIRGARMAVGMDELQVMIHLDQGGRYFYLKEWFSKAIENGLENFDVIGLSYYPFWHGTFPDLKETMERLIQDYHKPIMIVETAHAWRRCQNGFIDEVQEKIAGFNASPEGQAKALKLVMNITASLPEHMGRGVYYWEPLCIPLPGEGGWAENMGLLDENGCVMEGINVFGFTRKEACGEQYAKVYESSPVVMQPGHKPILPRELPVLCFDGSIVKHKVIWDTSMLNNILNQQKGEYVLWGKVEGVGEPAKITVSVSENSEEMENLVHDANWEQGLTEWTVVQDREHVIVQIVPEFVNPNPAPPLNGLRVEGVKQFKFNISQKIWTVYPGIYSLSVEFLGTDTTNVDIRLFVQSDEERRETVIHPVEHNWQIYKIENIRCKEEYLTIGISIQAPPVYGIMRNFRLVKTGI